MIVRNEESNLPRVLGSVLGLVDESVVVDTGSTDRSVEVAKSLGARVEFFEWIDDFSAARNHALSMARGDWIMVLDADDEFEREDIPLARRILETSRASGVSVRHFLLYPGEPPGVKRQMAFVRNRPEHRYVWRVHEQIPVDPATVERSALRVTHHGYTPELLPLKNGRNRRLLERMKSDPDPLGRVAASFYLGTLHQWEKRHPDAIREFKAAAYSGLPCPYRLYSVFRLAQLASMAGERDYAESLLRVLLDANPGLIEAELELADLCREAGRIDEARRHFEISSASRLRLLPYESTPWEDRARARLRGALFGLEVSR
ncbi:MAG: glycosyltransferase [Planctomycetes bacterium]|nr:glycosyltransferase [Planctomycetota bacterium]